MAIYNGNEKRRANIYNYHKRFLESIDVDKGNGKKHTKFFYFTEKTSAILTDAINKIKSRGINADEIAEEYFKRTGLMRTIFEDKFFSKRRNHSSKRKIATGEDRSENKGDVSLALWEFLMFLEMFDIEFKLVDNEAKFYHFSTEGNRLILRYANKNIQYHANINMDNIYDFEVDFSLARQHKSANIVLYRLFEKLLYRYYVIEAKGKKIPMNVPKMKKIFRQKYYAGETLHTKKKYL